jgi:hypothetical protein
MKRYSEGRGLRVEAVLLAGVVFGLLAIEGLIVIIGRSKDYYSWIGRFYTKRLHYFY